MGIQARSGNEKVAEHGGGLCGHLLYGSGGQDKSVQGVIVFEGWSPDVLGDDSTAIRGTKHGRRRAHGILRMYGDNMAAISLASSNPGVSSSLGLGGGRAHAGN